MNIGTLTKNSRGALAGNIATLMVAAAIILVPVDSTNANAPKFEIHAKNVAGNYVQIGAFWEKTANDSGELYLQGRINDPSFRDVIYITAFMQRDGSYNVVWTRSKPQAANTAFTERPRMAA